MAEDTWSKLNPAIVSEDIIPSRKNCKCVDVHMRICAINFLIRSHYQAYTDPGNRFFMSGFELEY